MRKYFSLVRKKYYWRGTKHGGYVFGVWIFFWGRSMPMYVHLRVLGICFLRYQENSHPENFHQLNSPLVNLPWKIPTWNVSTHVFKYSHSRFLTFFSLLLLLSLKLLKRRFCNFMFWKCWSQNKVLSDETQLMKWMGIFQVRIFWVVIFRWGREFSRGSLMGGNFSGGNSPGGNFPRAIFFI